MPSPHGQTSHQHDDYKIQRDLERVGRKGKSQTIRGGVNIGNTGAGGSNTQTGENDPNNITTLWALSVRKNNDIPIVNPKWIQSLNFKSDIMRGAGGFSVLPIKVDLESQSLEEKYKSHPENKIRQAEIGLSLVGPYIVTRSYAFLINTLPLPDPGGIDPLYMHRYSFDAFTVELGKFGWYVWTEWKHDLKLFNKESCHVTFEPTDPNQSFLYNWHMIDENTIAIYGIYKDLTYLADFYGTPVTVDAVASDIYQGFQMLNNSNGIQGRVTISGITGSMTPYA